MLRIRLFSCIVLAMTGLLATAAPSRAEQPLHFGIIQAEPFGMTRDGVQGGIVHDLAQAISQAAGIPFTYTLLPLPRLLDALGSGTVDATILLPAEKTLQITDALAEVVPVVNIVLPKAGLPLARYEDLQGRTIGILRGGNYDDRFAADPGIRKHEIPSYASGVSMVKEGRIDGMIGPEIGLYYDLKKAGVSRSDFSPHYVVNTRPLVLLVGKAMTDPATRARLKEASEAINRSGSAAGIVEGYLR